jgi:hypothetical protein
LRELFGWWFVTSTACGRTGKLQIPPLRFAPVGMTRFRVVYYLSSCCQLKNANLNLVINRSEAEVEGPAVCRVLKRDSQGSLLGLFVGVFGVDYTFLEDLADPLAQGAIPLEHEVANRLFGAPAKGGHMEILVVFKRLS